ncbi:Dolichyl-diphosphooligosaccharide--protein glycosyltransferase subunit 1 [Fasciola hepatica]|uniref:Dolichyl-diphosphooligosaccharide--protein glycosyltransferase subunit 1 n=1 Tax=Fasciola hepatica TaxID=6192 RepID=A0A4E0RFJ8_FASHE|nr:Dolichyl-diphosphooligosaccharide--protein glycosyltransferase subunit 1 [Fasciola hepatica]
MLSPRWLPALFCIFVVCDGLKNLKVTRNIDLKSPVTRIELEITVDDGKADYEFLLNPSEYSRLSWLSATVGLESLLFSLKPKGSQKELKVEKSSKPLTHVIHLENKPGQYEFVVLAVLTGQLDPKPKELLQGDNQYVKYTGDVYFYSHYSTEEQVTNILLPVGELLHHTSTPDPVTKSGNKLTYGPYKEKPALSHVNQLTRHIEISHWGNVAVEETLEIINAGAKLRGSFSRYDFDLGKGRKSAVASFKTALPAAAKHIYYRDEIGNISTSTVSELLDAVEVRLQPRFPLFGGWKTQYTLGYNVPAHEFLYRSVFIILHVSVSFLYLQIKEVISLDSRYRDLIQECVQLAERLISGKINKQQYQTSTNDITSKKADLRSRMDALIENL